MGRRSAHWVICIAVLLAGVGAASAETLTNQDVIALHKAGLPASVILAKIQSTPGSFDTSVEALVALSKAGVPAEVIAAMTGAAPTSPAGAPAPSAPPVQAASGHIVVQSAASSAANVRTNFGGTPCTSPGIFIETERGVIELEPSTYSGAKTRGFLASALSHGIVSVKNKAVISGTRSSIRVPSGALTMYFCFEESEVGLSYESKGATNPSEFVLIEFDVNHDKKQRLFVTGKYNQWVGTTSGAPPKFVREVTFEKLAPGVYRATPASILAPGEYGFYYAGSTPAAYGWMGVSTGGGGKVFTFGVG